MNKKLNVVGQISGEDLTDLSSLFEHLLSQDEHNVHHMVNINIGCKVKNKEFV